MWEWRPTRLAILRRAVLSFLGACLALAITDAVLPGLSIDGPGPLLLAGLLLLALDSSSDVVLHWLLVAWPIFVAQTLGLAVQFVAIIILGRVLPGVRVDGIATAVWGAVLLTLLNSLFAELVAVSDDDSYYSVLVRRLVARDFGRASGTDPGSAGRPDRRAEPARPAAGDSGRPGAGARPAGARWRGDPPPVDRFAARPRRRPVRRASCTAATTASPAFAGTRRRAIG